MEIENIDVTNLKPDVRHLNDMREVLYDKDFAENSPDMDLYYMYRNVDIKDGLKHNITVIPAKMFGSEFVKTAGHYHAGPQKELYNVLQGEAIFLMQKGDQEKIEDVYVVKTKPGESALIKSFYGHITINPSGEEMKTQDWSPTETKSDYSMFKKLQGACYYYIKDGSGQDKWIKNKNYKFVPDIRFEEPIKGVPEDLSFLK